MSRKFKVLISVLIAVLLLTASGTAVAMAQDEPDTAPQTGFEGLLARIADKLGITSEELTDAFNQARQEMQEECQATGDCPVCQNNQNQFKERWAQKQKETGRRFQGGRTETGENKRFRISESVRGRQQIAVPKGWQGSLSPGLVD